MKELILRGIKKIKNGACPQDQICFICSYQEQSDFIKVDNGSPLFQFQE